jgi:hypothetical protein
MRNAILGTVAGLLVGTAGALAYSHYLGDGSLLADLQAQLDSANAKLAQSETDRKFLAEQNKSSSDQLDQLVSSNEQLKKQLASGAPTNSAPTPAVLGIPAITPDVIRGFMGMMRGGAGGFRSPEQRMFLLQTRLKLDPDQAKAIKAAMDADNQARRDAFRLARQNGTRPDPQALAAANTLDKTLASVLSPTQQTEYQQEQADEKSARAESSATSQVDNLMPLLQLTDDQKEKAMNALYQQQVSAPDPASLLTNPNPLGALASQGQSVQSAMKQVLTPDQYALYQQDQQVQAQATANFGGGRNRGNNNGGNGNGGQGQGQAPGSVASGSATAPGAMTTYAPAAATPPPPATTPATTDAAATTTDPSAATTNAASATTNAPSASAN